MTHEMQNIIIEKSSTVVKYMGNRKGTGENAEKNSLVR
jgi:hypothetical protein